MVVFASWARGTQQGEEQQQQQQQECIVYEGIQKERGRGRALDKGSTYTSQFRSGEKKSRDHGCLQCTGCILLGKENGECCYDNGGNVSTTE